MANMLSFPQKLLRYPQLGRSIRISGWLQPRNKNTEGVYQIYWRSEVRVGDTAAGEARILLDAPLYVSQVLWSADSDSLVVTNTYLPLDHTEGEEREERRSKLFTIEINIRSGSFRRLLTLDQDSPVLSARWDRKTNQLA